MDHGRVSVAPLPMHLHQKTRGPWILQLTRIGGSCTCAFAPENTCCTPCYRLRMLSAWITALLYTMLQAPSVICLDHCIAVHHATGSECYLPGSLHCCTPCCRLPVLSAWTTALLYTMLQAPNVIWLDHCIAVHHATGSECYLPGSLHCCIPCCRHPVLSAWTTAYCNGWIVVGK